MDRVHIRRDPLLHDEVYEYDLNGNKIQVTDRKSQLTQLTYDPLNRLTQVTYADNSTISYTYDAANRVTQVSDSIAGTTTYGYDNLDRLTSTTTPEGTISYTYDAAGRRTTMSVTGQPTANYTYDNANRLTQITRGSATVTFDYDNADRRSSLTLPNGVITEYGYDAASQLTSLTYRHGGNTLGDLTYEYDANGKRTRMGGSYARSLSPQEVSSATYNAANQQLTFGPRNMSYDLNGNLTSDGQNTYTWDARNHLTAISGPGVEATFQYDPFGARRSKTVNGMTTSFLYDGVNVVQEQSSQDGEANLLSGRIDELFTRSGSSGTFSPLLDGLGSSLSLTDSAGAVQTDYSYSAFGQPATTGSSNNNATQYTGRENDETSLQYNRARYYSPTLQRFISEDPIGAAGGDFNFYAYVKNNPVSLVDPAGLATGEIGLAGSGKIIVGVMASISIAVDDSGNVGLVLQGGPGAGIAAEFRGGIMCHVSNAHTIEDLAGPTVQGSVSAGMGPDVALDAFVGRNPDGSPLVGGGFTVGAGVGGGASVSGTWTKVYPLFKFGGRGCQDTKNLPPPRPLPPSPTPSPTPAPGPPCDLPIPMICYPDPIPQPAPEPRR